MKKLLPTLVFLLVSLFLTAQEPVPQERSTQEAAIENHLRQIGAMIDTGTLPVEVPTEISEIEARLTNAVETGTPDQARRGAYLLFLVRSSTGDDGTLSDSPDIPTGQGKGSNEKTLFRLSATGGLVGMGLFGLFSGLYAASYSDYLDASGSEADRLKDEWRLWETARYLSLGVGTASLTAAALLMPLPEPDSERDVARLRYEYAGLEGSGALRMERILSDQAALMQELNQRRQEAAPYLKWRNISLIGAGGFTAVAATVLILGEVAYHRYESAIYTSDAVDFREAATGYGYLGAAGGIAALLSLGSAGVLELLRPKPEPLEDRLRAYEVLVNQEHH